MRRFLTIIFLGLSLGICAQQALIPDMKFRRLDSQNGLSSSQVNCVFKDSRGYIWIGTPYGLNRYDGYRIKTFYSNIRDTTSMRDNYTDQVYEAFDGRLWLKQGMNYCVYDPKSELFIRNAAHELSKYGIKCSIERLHIDSNKNFWIKDYGNALHYYNPKTRRHIKFKIGYEKNEFNPTYGISTMAELNGNLVVATNNGELVCLNGEKSTVEWEDKWMREHGSPENQEYRLVIDKHGNYWCPSLYHTYCYIRSENKWYGSIVDYLASQGITGLPENVMIWSVAFDQKDRMWLCCDHEGLIVVDLKTKQWKQFKNNRFDETTISDNTLRNILITDDGNVWIGTYKNGANQYVEGLASLKSIELGDVNTVCEDKYGNYWVGTNDQGILVYDPKTGETVNHFSKNNSGLSGDIIVGSWPASDGTIWFGSYNGGLIRCIPSAGNPTQATIVNYLSNGRPDGLANNSVWALTEDKWNRIWFTTLGGGLQVFDPKTSKFRTWNANNSKLPSDYMTSIGWTKKGWVIAGTSYYYTLVNPSSGKLVAQVLPEDPDITVNISSTAYVIEDSRGLIWQGSTSGLAVYDPATKFIQLLDMTDGLFGSSINSIVEDKNKNVWAVTEHGVSMIAPVKQEDGTWQFNIRSFNSRDGLQKATYNQRSTWLTRDGLLLVGGQAGIDIINPAKLTDNELKEKPIFSGLQIFDQDVAVGKEFDGRIILREALNVCRKLSLSFNDQFTIQLATDGVIINNHHRFAYKLEGFNDNWVKTSEQNPNITYNSLRAGSYILHVRILKEDGTLGEEESQLRITINPPLWRTRWMILIYMLLILGAALLWRRYFMKKQNERMELETLRRETEKKHWISEMRRQMMTDQPQAGEAGLTPDEAATGKPQWERLDIVPLFKDVCDHFTAPAGKNVRLSFFPFVDNLEITGDRAQLRMLLDILLKNAATFSPSNSKVKVFVEKQDNNAVIRVADSGIGISEDIKPHLFDEIIGDDDSPNLHLVFDIVAAHHGNVRAEENNGGGSLFIIELPCDEEDIEIEEAVLMEDE